MKNEFRPITNLEELRQANIGDFVELYSLVDNEGPVIIGSGELYGRYDIAIPHHQIKVRLVQHINHCFREIVETDFTLENYKGAFRFLSKGEKYFEPANFESSEHTFDSCNVQ